MDISKYLKHGKERTDIRIFENWSYNVISTETAIKRFKRNNEIKEDINIKKEDFEKWLISLGYSKIGE